MSKHNWKYVDPRPLTPLQIFDASVKHILEQGKPSVSSNGSCAYRTECGLQCGASIFISDDEYSEGCEGLPASFLPEECDVLSDVKPKQILAIEAAQSCHDTALTPRGDFITNYKQKIKEKRKRFENTNSNCNGETQ